MSSDPTPKSPVISISLVLVAPIIALIGTFLTVWNQYRLEDLRWKATREDALNTELRREIQQFSTNAVSVSQSIRLVSSHGYDRPEALSNAITGYKETTVPILIRVPANLAIIATFDPAIYQKLKTIGDKLVFMDNNLTKVAGTASDVATIRSKLNSISLDSEHTLKLITDTVANSVAEYNQRKIKQIENH
jgi:hypothetical protein